MSFCLRTASLVVLVLMLLPVGQLAAAEGGQKWAILIGVDDYAELVDLQYAGNDQRAFAEQLVASGFPTDQVFLLDDKAKNKKYLPFRENIERQLNLMLQLVEAKDLLIVGFSGHGVQLDGKSYLCPSEARLESPQETMIPLDTVYERLSKCPASLKLLFVDACRDDPRPGGQRSANSRSTAGFANSLERPPEGLLLMTSCAPGQVSMEDEAFGHGVFMNFILEGMRGKAANTEGNVTLASLYDYASLSTKKYVARKWNGYQSPSFKGQMDGPFELCHIEKGEIDNSIGMKLVRIEAGEFTMGGAPGETSKPRSWEAQHRVRITRPFYMGATEVTLGQFLKFYHDAHYRVDAERDGKGGTGYYGGNVEERASAVPWSWGYDAQTNSYPVVNVTYNDAVQFCKWLSRKEGKTYRLPTEAEWEYACRAGTTTRFWFGDDFEQLVDYANVSDVTTMQVLNFPQVDFKGSDGFALTAPVGRFRPNAWGLHDMHGNVWEWCADWYSDDYYRQSPSEDPKGPESGTMRVLRGGGWNGTSSGCRCGNRFPIDPSYRHPDTGFRVVCEP